MVESGTKPCTKCGAWLPLTMFSRNRNHADGYKYQCKGCDAKERREARAEAVDLIANYKLSCGCADCGYAEHACALDFDHLPEYKKKFTISDELHRSVRQIQEEMAKCEVVCANCHRVRTKRRIDEL